MKPASSGFAAGSLAMPILAASLAAFGGLLTGGVLYYRDISLLHRPVRSVIRAAWAEGSLPLLDPAMDGGRHLLANPNHRVLHPTALLDLLFSADMALAVATVLQVFLAGWGLALLLRRYGLSTEAARVGGLAFALAGPVLSLGNLPNLLGGMAWVPWILLAGTAAHSRPLRHLPAAMLFAAVPLLAGGVESTGTALLILGMVALAGNGRGRSLAVTAGTAAGSVLLAGVVMLPAVRMLRGSERGLGFRSEQLYYWSLQPGRLLEMVVPGLWGSPADPSSWWGGSRFDSGVPLILSAYLGATVITLALAGGWALLRRPTVDSPPLAAPLKHLLLAAGGMGIVLIFLALGRHNPLLRVSGDIPLAGALLRFPERLLPLAVLPVAMAAAVGWQAVAGDCRRLRRLPGYLWAAAGLVALPLLVSHGMAAGGRIPLTPELTGPAAATAAVQLTSGTTIALAAVAMLLVAAWMSGRRASARLAGPSAAVLVALDLVVAGAGINPAAEPAIMDEIPAAAAFLSDIGEDNQRPRLMRGAEPSIRGEGIPPGVEVLWSRRSLSYRIPEEYGLAVGLQSDVDRSTPLGNAFLRMAWESAGDAAKEQIVHRAAVDWQVDFVAEASDVPADAAWAGRVFAPAPILVLRPRPGAARRFSVVPQGLDMGHLADHGVLPRMMQALGDPNRDPQVEVLLTGLVGGSIEGNWPAGEGLVEVVRDRATELVLDVELPGEGVLVVRDSFIAGWTATVDGEEAAIVRADLAWRGVPLAAGRHQVAFTYRQPGLALGAAGSGVGLLLVLGMQVAVWRRHQEPLP